MKDTYTERFWKVETFEPHSCVSTFAEKAEAEKFYAAKVAADVEAYIWAVDRVTDSMGMWQESVA